MEKKRGRPPTKKTEKVLPKDTPVESLPVQPAIKELAFLNEAFEQTGVMKMSDLPPLSDVPMQTPTSTNATDVVHCGSCGVAVENQARFCKNCGSELDWSNVNDG